MRVFRTNTELDRLREARDKVAVLTADDPVFAPSFERLDTEGQRAEALASPDLLARARAAASAQSAMRSSRP